jgi:hypothetical protein
LSKKARSNFSECIALFQFQPGKLFYRKRLLLVSFN